MQKFISFIPRTDHAKKISNFRPISLVGSVYKIISKALTCRLKTALGGVISPNQNAFLGGRQAMDGVLVANECIDVVLKNGSTGVLEKVYDRVHRQFLDYMLGRMGFGKKWRKCMRKCYGTAHFSMLVNSSTVENFHGSRGLRQGDHLSPFLFLIVAKAFGSLLTRAF